MYIPVWADQGSRSGTDRSLDGVRDGIATDCREPAYQVQRAVGQLLRAFRQTHKKLLDQIAKEKSLSDESEAALTEFLTSFTKNFS